MPQFNLGPLLRRLRQTGTGVWLHFPLLNGGLLCSTHLGRVASYQDRTSTLASDRKRGSFVPHAICLQVSMPRATCGYRSSNSRIGAFSAAINGLLPSAV